MILIYKIVYILETIEFSTLLRFFLLDIISVIYSMNAK